LSFQRYVINEIGGGSKNSVDFLKK